jgi:hypothetical protein
MIPGIDNCQKCHAPRREDNGVVSGGVRFHCTECHRYHNGAHPLQGIGAAARAPAERRGLEDFLRGTFPEPPR